MIIVHSLRWNDIEYDIIPNINEENMQLKPTNTNDTAKEAKLKIFKKLKCYLSAKPYSVYSYFGFDGNNLLNIFITIFNKQLYS